MPLAKISGNKCRRYCLAFGIFLSATPVLAEPIFTSFEAAPPVALSELKEVGGRLYAVAADRRRWRVDIAGDRATFVPAKPQPAEILPANALSDGIVAVDQPTGLRGWLTHPTRRYDHGVLGDRIEAGGFRIADRHGSVFDYLLDDRSVFEDRMVRFWDVDGDGTPEIVAVRSRLNAGAQLAVFGLAKSGIVEIASSRPIGRAYRWLNPIAAADFDGDGRIEVAAVITPHLGALLRLFRLNRDRLEPVYEAYGFSNHGICMRSQGLDTVVDVNGDSVPDLIVPNAARKVMRVVTFAKGIFRELGRVGHQSSIAGNAVLFQHNEAPAVAYPLKNGRISIIRFPNGRQMLTKR